MTENRIGDEGAKSLSEILEENKTLTELNLESEKEKGARKRMKDEE